MLSRSNGSTRTEVLSSIISANTNTDLDFFEGTTNPFFSGGFNLIGDGNATGVFNQTGDQINVADPGLDPLGFYGGPTQTHRLQSDSPALDAALRCPPPATDQRGVTRPQDGNADSTPGCDIGSFELEESSDITTPRVKRTVPGVNALDTGSRCFSAGSLVPQDSPHLRRRARVGTQRVVGPGRADFLRVAFSDRHGKSPTGLCGTPDRRGLLRGVNG